MKFRAVAKRLIRLVTDRSTKRSFAESTPQQLSDQGFDSLRNQNAEWCKLQGLRGELTSFCDEQETESQFRSAQLHKFFTLSNLR